MTNSNRPKTTTRKHIARQERERQQVAIIQTVSAVVIAVVVLLVGYGILDTTYLRFQKPVATVNGETINLGYFQERVQWQRVELIKTLQLYQFYQQNFGLDTSQQQQQIQFQLQSDALLGEQVFNLLIDEAVIRQEAKKLGITVSADEIEAKIQQSGDFNFYPNGTPTPTITPTDVLLPTLTTEQLKLYPPTSTPTPFLSPTPGPTNTPDPASTPTAIAQASPTPIPQLPTATSTPYTLDGFKSQYDTLLTNLKTFSISEKTYRSVFENQIYRDKMLAEIGKDAPTSVEQVLARHILVDNVQLAGVVEALLQGGQDFAEVAKKYSKDTGSAANGGVLGWATRETYVKEFGDAAFSQPIGEIGKPVQSQFGYHIIQVIAREELPANASQIQNNQQTFFTDWLIKLVDQATTDGKITKNDDVWRNNLPALPSSVQQQ